MPAYSHPVPPRRSATVFGNVPFSGTAPPLRLPESYCNPAKNAYRRQSVDLLLPSDSRKPNWCSAPGASTAGALAGITASMQTKRS